MSLNDGKPGVQGNPLLSFVLEKGKPGREMGILLLDSTFLAAAAGAVGMWDRAFCDFQGLWEKEGNLPLVSSFHCRPFHSPACRFCHALCLRPKLANSFCFSSASFSALAVSLSRPAFGSFCSSVSSVYIPRQYGQLPQDLPRCAYHR